ncbi:MAG: hypothetical protein SD837_07945 [Candidatus Electrothrix scaldis]|nr:MAG: hypothetical protein SD837_07945 [Candidatus Electrothrix sp. GW3-3]
MLLANSPYYVVFFLVLLSINACSPVNLRTVKNDPESCFSVWNKPPKSKECIIEQPPKSKKCIIEHIKIKENDHEIANLHLGFLEFTERGNLFDNDSRDRLLEMIKNDADNEGVLVVVYAHGWNHNSSFYDGDVQSFREALVKITKMEELRRGREVYGVYLGWRGRVLPWYFNHALTYWDRKSVAREIGKGGVSDILLRLDAIDKSRENNTLFIAGHSFGAEILSSAVNEILLHRMVERKYNKDRELSKLADAIVLVNPAVEANQFLQLYELSLDEDVTLDLGRKNLLTIISSNKDIPAKYVFPIGQFFETLFVKQEIISREKTFQEDLSEFELELTTAGQFKPFHTENLYVKKEDDSGQVHLEFEKCYENPNECRLSNDKGKFLSNKKIPISFIYTDDNFIEDHNDIFNDKLISYLVTAMSGAAINGGKLDKNDDSHSILTANCMKDDEFNFSKCFDFFYKIFSSPDAKEVTSNGEPIEYLDEPNTSTAFE